MYPYTYLTNHPVNTKITLNMDFVSCGTLLCALQINCRKFVARHLLIEPSCNG
jgi:hypothetical protein